MTTDSTLADQSQVTQCPNCSMAFLISDEQLLVANGQVRCGSCLTIFQADQYWLTDPDTSGADSTTADTDQSNNDADSVAATAHPANGPSQQRGATASPNCDFELSDSFLNINEPEALTSSFEAFASDDDEIVPNEEQWAKALLEEEEEPSEKKPPRNDILSAILDQSAEEYDSSPTPAAMPQGHGSDHELAPEELGSAEKWMQGVLGRQPQENGPSPGRQDNNSGTSMLPNGTDHAEGHTAEPTEEYVPEIFRNAKQRRQPPAPPPAAHQQSAIARLSESQLVSYCHSLSRVAWHRFNRMSGMVAIGIATLALMLQLIWSRSDQLYQYAALQPALAAFCQWGGCTLPKQPEPLLITQNHAIVYRSAHQQGILTLTSELQNTSTIASRYPRLQAELTDKEGRVVAARTVSPEEYLPANALPAELSPDKTFSDKIAVEPSLAPQLPPGQTLQLTLQLIDPGAHAVNYRLKLIAQGH